jgi:chromosome transmission fidelity protein 1
MDSGERLVKRFPFTPHPEQLRAMLAVRTGIDSGGVTIIESPTGTGKTLVLLTACLDSVHHPDFESGKDEPEWVRKHRIEMMRQDASFSGHDGLSRSKRHKPAQSNIEKLLSICDRLDDDKVVEKSVSQVIDDFVDSTSSSNVGPIRVVYASRTHSQLRQVLKELDLVNKERAKAVIVGGRSLLCINDRLKKDDRSLGEKCADLQSTTEGCPYWHPQNSAGNVEELVKRLAKVDLLDIEEAVREGRECRACPYYTVTLAMSRQASIVLVPYPLLFSQSVPVDKNTIVVIDEAHNLLDHINQSESKAIEDYEGVKMAADQLSKYFTQYGKRMSGVNAANCQQLLFVIGNLSHFMANYGGEEGEGRSMSVLQFMELCSIDTINLVKLLEYARLARLPQKLDLPCLWDILGFIGKLSEQSDNGRILVIPSDSTDDGKSGTSCTIKYVNIRASSVMEPIVTNSKALILAGGTMSPISDMVENLFPNVSVSHHSFSHVIPPDRFAVSLISTGPSGHRIDCRLEYRADAAMWRDVGAAVVNFRRITKESMCVFFASFPLLYQALHFFSDNSSNNGVLRALSGYGPVYIEDRERGASGVEAMLKDYSTSPKATLFAVIGGRLSEGVNLKDNLCRTMIVVGLPYLNEKDVEVAERVRFGGGSRYLHNQCMRKLNQCIGRALRHARDFAYILLLDARFESVRKDLPVWMHESVQVTSFPAAFARATKFFKKQYNDDGDNKENGGQ